MSLIQRRYLADGSEFIDLRRKGSGELVATSQAGRWLVAEDATKAEREEIKAYAA